LCIDYLHYNQTRTTAVQVIEELATSPRGAPPERDQPPNRGQL